MWKFVIVWNDGRCTNGEHDGTREGVLARARSIIGDNGGSCFAIIICPYGGSPEQIW